MRAAALSVLALVLNGCSSVYVGAGVHPTALSEPEVRLANPVCYVGGVVSLGGPWALRAEHTSACFVTEDGIGYNEASIQYHLY